jgi:hypothetical protein
MKIPGIRERFKGPTVGADVVTDTVAIPDLENLGTKQRIEIAEVLVGLLDYNAGVVGFDWRVGEKELYISYIEGFQQRQLDNPAERVEVMNLLVTVLKTKREITGIKWDFGDVAIEVSHII